MITICSKHPVMTEWSNFKKQNAAKKTTTFYYTMYKGQKWIEVLSDFNQRSVDCVCVCVLHTSIVIAHSL